MWTGIYSINILFIIFIFLSSKSFAQEEFELIGQIHSGPSSTLDMEDSTIYFNNGYCTLQSMQINQSNEFITLGGYTFNETGYIQKLCVLDKFVYVAYAYGGLMILDFYNPTEPTIIGRYKPKDINNRTEVNCVALKGNYLFLGNINDLHIIDITDPYNYKLVNIYKGFGNEIIEIKLSGNYICLTSYSGYELLNISNPSNPERLHRDYIQLYDLELLNDKIYLCLGYNGIKVFSLTNHGSPTEEAHFQNNKKLRRIGILNSKQAFINSDKGNFILDISDPSNILELETLDINPFDFYVADNLFIEHGGLLNYSIIKLYSYKETDSFTLLNSYVNSCRYQSIALYKDYAYVADYNSGYLRILNIDNHKRMYEKNYLRLFNEHYFTSLCNFNKNYLLALAGNKILTLDISNKDRPYIIDSLILSNYRENIFISDSHAFLTNDYGLDIINLKNPQNIEKITTINVQDVNRILVMGNYLFLANGGLKVYDISDISQPKELKIINWEDYVFSMDIIGDYLYVCAGFRKLYVMDISNPLNISLIKIIEYNDEELKLWRDIRIYQNIGYFHLSNGTVEIYSLKNPLSPQLIKKDNVGNYIDIQFTDNKIYYTFLKSIDVYKIGPIFNDTTNKYTKRPNFTLNQNYPNPFNLNTNISFHIHNKTMVTLKVFDILGSTVETLVDNPKTAGFYKINYKTSNLSSGIYFYSLRAGDFTDTKKMILVK